MTSHQSAPATRGSVVTSQVKLAFAKHGITLRAFPVAQNDTILIGHGPLPSVELDPVGTAFSYRVFVYRTSAAAQLAASRTPRRDMLYGVLDGTLVKRNVLVLYRRGIRELTLVRAALDSITAEQ
jgi:hypothetical protein